MDKQTKEILDFANRDNSEEDKLIESILKETRELSEEEKKPEQKKRKKKSRVVKEIFNSEKGKAEEEKKESHSDDGTNAVIFQIREFKREAD